MKVKRGKPRDEIDTRLTQSRCPSVPNLRHPTSFNVAVDNFSLLKSQTL